MLIEEYFGDWSKVLDLQQADAILRKIVQSKQIVCPSIKNVFRAFQYCSLNTLRAVIVGQDPYPNLHDNKPVATGIAFANAADTLIKDYSPSLNILRESVIDFTKPHGNINFDPSLEKWADQGVLLLNTALTCKAWNVGSHRQLWRPFIQHFLQSLSHYTTGCIFILMGNDASSFEPYIDKVNNYIFKVRHPAWYARNRIPMPSSLWKEVNDILIGQNGYGIEWYQEY